MKSTKAVPSRFDQVSESYSTSRRGVPNELLGMVRSIVGSENRHILDLGCGTGISARQLAKLGCSVIGLDPSKNMIIQALEHKTPNVSYAVGGAEEIPFNQDSFDAVTCFSSFHWFCNQTAIEQIRQVLRRSGHLILVNKHERSDLRNHVRIILSNTKGVSLQSPKNKYDPLAFLLENGWSDATQETLQYQESYDFEELLTYIKSFSSWGYLSPSERNAAEQEIIAYCRKLTESGRHEQVVDLTLIWAGVPECH